MIIILAFCERLCICFIIQKSGDDYPMNLHVNSNSRGNSHAVEQEDRLPLLLAFLLPVVIMLGVFAGKSIYPFGDESFLRTDMYHQYAPFFAEFARLLKQGGSLTYSTQIGLGSNFVALYAYYLSSPFNWLLILTPAGAVVEFMTYLIVLKIGLCGFTMGYYLKKKYRKNTLAIPAVSTFYALSGYMAAYSWNIMWLDCLWLAPLILLGLERLVRRNQPFLYGITLGLAIISNYYIAIMLCIFIVLYFISEMLTLPRLEPKEYLKKCLLFGMFSLLAGGLAAFLLLPAYECLMTTASADSKFPGSITSYFSVLEMLARHMVNVDVEIGLEHWPNLYSGVGCFLLFPLYILNEKISAREKVVKTSLLAVMLLSFSLNVPNYIWHGMHYPNSLPCRQSFLYTIVILTMCYDGLRRVKDLTPRQLTACFWGDAAFILICQVVVTAEEFHYYVYYLSLLFIGIYALLIYLVQKKKMLSTTACILALAVIVVESGINTAVTSVTTVNRTEYWRNTANYQSLVHQAEEADESGFFRVEKPTRRTKNDGAWADYSSASIFSSTTQSAISDFYKTFGMEGNTNAYSFTGATPLMSSLLSVRYLISPSELQDSPLYEEYAKQDTALMYENLYTLPLGFMIPEGISENFRYGNPDNPPSAQNELVQLTTGGRPVLVEIADDGGADTLEFTTESEGRVFVWVDNSNVENVTAYLDDAQKSFSNVDRGYLLDLGICEEDTDISVSTTDDEYSLEATAYLFDDEAFIEWYNRMSLQTFQLTDYANRMWRTEIIGDITVRNPGMLLTSIPYDKGWSVMVDGAPVEAQAFADTFLMIPLTADTHTIDLVYRTPGLTEGIFLSVLSLIFLLFLAFTLSFRNRRKRPQLPKYRGGSRPEPGRWKLRFSRKPAAAPVSGTKERHDTEAEEQERYDEELEEMLLEDTPEGPHAPAKDPDEED